MDEDKKVSFGRRSLTGKQIVFWICVAIGCIVLLANSGQNNTPSSAGDAAIQAVPQDNISTGSASSKNDVSAPSPTNTPSPQQATSQMSNSGTQGPPRNSDGTIVQLKITAAAKPGRIDFTSEANYTNCTNDLTVISVDGNQQPTFNKYTDISSTGLNLFVGDQHSIAYGELIGSDGNTLAADIASGKYGNNTAGNWGITCDQGEYSLTIN